MYEIYSSGSRVSRPPLMSSCIGLQRDKYFRETVTLNETRPDMIYREHATRRTMALEKMLDVKDTCTMCAH